MWKRAVTPSDRPASQRTIHRSWGQLTGYHKIAPLILGQPQVGECVTDCSAEIDLVAQEASNSV